jgi:hypothetical protein
VMKKELRKNKRPEIKTKEEEKKKRRNGGE